MIVHSSPLPDVEIYDTTITDLVLRRTHEIPDRVAIMDGETERRYTYAQLRDLIRRFAGGLRARGFGPGDTLALMAPNVPEYAIVFHGVAVAGGTVTTVNPTYGAEEVRFQLQDAGASMLVTLGMFADTAHTAIAGTAIGEIYTLDAHDGTIDAMSLLGEPIDQVSVTPDDVVVLPYSSGTTGLPKGVMLSHRNLVANICQCEHTLQYDAQDEVALAVLPFFHIYGMQVLMNHLLAEGATIITMARFDMEAALRLVEAHRVTRFFAVPPIVLGLAKHPVVDQFDLSSLRMVFSGAAPLGADLAAEASARIGCEVVQGFGMTELSPVSHCTTPGGFKPGTVGVTISNTQTRIVDLETGDDQPIDGAGEVLVKGPQVMLGYLNNDEATAATIDADGWLHTGDVGLIDADGHLTIVDRVKELIKYKGFQVPPAELEALLIAHPHIADVAVIGVADTEAGELPKAFVVPVAGSGLTEHDVKAHVAGHVASYKHIRIVEFVDEIPKSASGKILRRLLRERS